MIKHTSSDRSLASCRSLSETSNHRNTMGQTISSCSLQSQRPMSSIDVSEHSQSSTCGSQTQQSASRSFFSLGKRIACKCIESSYGFPGPRTEVNSREENTTPWLHFVFVFLLSVKLQLLFEHSICLLSLIATRYLAGKTRKGSILNKLPEDLQFVRTASLSSGYHHSSDSTISSTISSNKQESQDISRINSSGRMKKGNDTSQPSAMELSKNSQESSLSTCASQTWSQQGLDIQSPKRAAVTCENVKKVSPTPSSFLPSHNEACMDDWGQFADFDDDFQVGCDSGVIADDPFRSINKTILKRRGDKLSICKLDQLQEEEEDDLDEDEERW